VLVGQRTPEAAVAVVRYHLDRLFAPAPPGPTARVPEARADGA